MAREGEKAREKTVEARTNHRERERQERGVMRADRERSVQNRL